MSGGFLPSLQREQDGLTALKSCMVTFGTGDVCGQDSARRPTGDSGK